MIAKNNEISYNLQILLQYITIAAYHALLFVYLPESNQKPFNSQWSLIVFYLLKCIYWWLSDLQVHGVAVSLHRNALLIQFLAL